MHVQDTELSRRRLLQLFGVGAGALALAACAPSAPAPAGAGNASAGALGSKTKAPATNFTFAGWSLAEDSTKAALQANLDAYASKAGVKATPVSYPYNEYLNQLTLQVRGGQFYGAAQLDIAWLGTLASLGKLADVSALTSGHDYTKSSLAAGQFNGKQYGLPWAAAAIGLVANSELLGKVGAKEIPATIADFEALLRELKGAGLVPYAASTKVAQLKDIQVWMQTFGSPLLDNGKITIGDDASVEALTWYKKLYDDGLIAKDVDRFDARSLFAQGRAAIYDDAPAGRAAVLKASSDPELKNKLLPGARPVVKSGDTPRALAWGHTVVVVDGPGAATAGDFAQWLTSDQDTVTAYFKVSGNPPTTDGALASSAVAGDAFISAFTKKITATATPSPFWAFPNYGQIDSAINQKVQAALIGQLSPKDALAQARDAAQALVG